MYQFIRPKHGLRRGLMPVTVRICTRFFVNLNTTPSPSFFPVLLPRRLLTEFVIRTLSPMRKSLTAGLSVRAGSRAAGGSLTAWTYPSNTFRCLISFITKTCAICRRSSSCMSASMDCLSIRCWSLLDE